MDTNIVQPITWFLILRAFANGTSSVTGVEAISNGITAFKEPRSRNAGKTLLFMAGILGSLLLGVTFLAVHTNAMPVESETMISQIAQNDLQWSWIAYLATISATTIILVMAANTAFADFPRLGALTAARWVSSAAADLPRQQTGLFPRNCCSGIDRFNPCDWFSGKRNKPDPALCHWRFPVLHSFTDWHGAPVVEIGPPQTRDGSKRTRIDS